MKPTRRQMTIAGLAAFGAAGAAPLAWEALKPKSAIPGAILGAASGIGHHLRDGGFPAPSAEESHDVVIVGSGIAGLGCARMLDKLGVRDFTMLELEDHSGGNAHSGQNAVSSYPWGAHYVPLLSDEATDVRALFEELGIITGQQNGLNVYNEDYILSDPDERLFIAGRWQEGLVPATGVTAADTNEYKRFLAQMEAFKAKRGGDGRRWFAIPMDESSIDTEARALDRLTMKAWMLGQGYTSKPLHWFVNYGCRDDFGVPHDQISAYAGIHYFAARNGKAANTAPDSVITWPEGNGFLAHRLAEPVRDRIMTGALAYALRRSDKGAEVDAFDVKTQKSVRFHARAVVLASPRFVSARLDPGLDASGFTYAPWAVANLTLSRMPEGKGAELAWDNVFYDSDSLGYVVATHQVAEMEPLKTVITYYWPLTATEPAEARRQALAMPYEDWQKRFLGDLLRAHPELHDAVERLDVWLWGHAMIRPVPGFIWGPERARALQQTPPVFTAHSDMSGISIFEEAYTHGVKAARAVRSFLA